MLCGETSKKTGGRETGSWKERKAAWERRKTLHFPSLSFPQPLSPNYLGRKEEEEEEEEIGAAVKMKEEAGAKNEMKGEH